MIIFPGVSSESAAINQSTPPGGRKHVYYVEFGYCDDGKVTQKIKAKLNQHEKHAEWLQQQGWVVAMFPIAMTYSGCTTSSLTANLLPAMGLSLTSINKLLVQLQHHTVNYNDMFIRTRKVLSRSLALPSAVT